MTHDELLYRTDLGILKSPVSKALRAVVELHKPNIKGGCDICSWILGGFVLYEVCPTIQAIESALNG